MISKNFAVVGAGPKSLMAGMELLGRGHQVDIYERDDRIGGMSASFDFDGLKIECYTTSSARPTIHCSSY